jgi:ABC-2 type transport system permease protein
MQHNSQYKLQRSFQRIGAVLLRYLFLLRSSWPRLIELAFWPTLEMIIWGFTSSYLSQHMTNAAYGAGVLIAGALLWDFLIRSQIGISMGFLEELWSRNLGHLFISPLRPQEWMAALIASSVMRAMISVVPAVLLAIVFYHYNLFTLGLPLVGFIACLLVMGWWFGFLVISVIMRFGQGAEVLAWMIIYAVAPVSAVFYPVSTLPGWLQAIAFILPSSHIFEGMRAIIIHGYYDAAQMGWAIGLNIIYMIIGATVLWFSIQNARNRGALLVVGE